MHITRYKEMSYTDPKENVCRYWNAFLATC